MDVLEEYRLLYEDIGCKDFSDKQFQTCVRKNE